MSQGGCNHATHTRTETIHHRGVSFGLSIIGVVKEFQEFYPDVQIPKQQLYQRVQKIQVRSKEEIEALQETDASPSISEASDLYLSPRWRARYLRRILRKVKEDDLDMQIKVLKELRSEAKLLLPVSPEKPIETDNELVDLGDGTYQNAAGEGVLA